MMKKIAIASSAVCATLLLSACQSNTQVQQPKHERMLKQHQDGRMAKHQHMRSMHKATQHACVGKKVGDPVNLTLGQRQLNGSCEMVFMPERGQKALKSHYKMQASQPKSRNSVLTDAERAEMVKQFDLRLAQRQAQQKAIQTACQGQSAGKAVHITFADQTINGQCQLKFKPQLQTKVA